jgi:RHS repeat-associated protein
MSNSLPIAIFKYNWTNSGSMAWEFAAPLPHPTIVPTRTMTYDDDNRLATLNGSSVTSDLDGNLTSAPLTNSTFFSYAYDARNRLLNAGGVTNTYDAINNRIGQTFGTNTTTFVVNPNAKLPQVLVRIKNGMTNYYIYGVGLLYQITETATATNTLTYHYDYRGSTVALSSDNGIVTDRIEYSAYGLTTYRVGISDTPFLFNGRYGVQTDPNGLLYMRARYYNPYLCRFVSADPSGFAGGLNHYAYANGNPISLLDPFGLNAAATGDTFFTWTPNTVSPEQQAMNSMSLVAAGIDYNPNLVNIGNEPSALSIFLLGLGPVAAELSASAAIVGTEATSIATPAYTSATRAFWTGETTGLPAAQASGASILQLSPEAQAAFNAGNPALMIIESTAWAQGAVGENAAVFIGNGVGRTFWSAEFPQLMNNLNNGSLNQIIFHF